MPVFREQAGNSQLAKCSQVIPRISQNGDGRCITLELSQESLEHHVQWDPDVIEPYHVTSQGTAESTIRQSMHLRQTDIRGEKQSVQS